MEAGNRTVVTRDWESSGQGGIGKGWSMDTKLQLGGTSAGALPHSRVTVDDDVLYELFQRILGKF